MSTPAPPLPLPLPPAAVADAVSAAIVSSNAVAPAVAAAPAAAPVVPVVATVALTPAAAARAKKLAAGGMDFVERPGGVHRQPQRNLAPPPPRPADAVWTLVQPSAPVAVVPAAPSFSVTRWFCTSSSGWSWFVRALVVALTSAAVVVAFQYYRAWRQRMDRWQRACAEKDEKKRITEQSASAISPLAVDSSSSSSASASVATSTASATASDVPAPTDGAGNFRVLTALISSRYALLQRFATSLKHVRPSDAPSASASSSVVHVSRLFDEVDSLLAENAYLRDLLQRISGSLKKPPAAR